MKVVRKRPRESQERVKVLVKAKGLTIATPAGCEADEAEVSLETALDLRIEDELTRVGTIGSWRCKKKGLRGG